MLGLQLLIAEVRQALLFVDSEIIGSGESFDFEEGVVFPKSLDVDVVVAFAEVEVEFSALAEVELVGDDGAMQSAD